MKGSRQPGGDGSRSPREAKRPALPFPTRVPTGPARGAYRRFRFDLAPDARHHFSIALPRDWYVNTAEPVAPSPEDPVRIAATLASASQRSSRAEVVVFHVAREIAPADWLDIFLQKRGEEVVNRREAESPGGTCADVLSRLVAGRATYVSRWLVLKTGPTLFLVHCSTPQSEYRRFACHFGTAAVTFRLLHPAGGLFAEPMQTLALPIPRGLRVLVPQSWSLLWGAGSNTRAVSFSAYSSVGDRVAGPLTLAGVTRSAEPRAEGLVESYLGELRRNRVAVDTPVLTAGSAYPPFDAVWQGRAEGHREGEPVEVRAFVGRTERGWFLAGLLGPSRSTSSWVWAVNRRAFDIASGSVRSSLQPTTLEEQGVRSAETAG